MSSKLPKVSTIPGRTGHTSLVGGANNLLHGPRARSQRPGSPKVCIGRSNNISSRRTIILIPS
ncbi:hypothetical protein HMPREF1549_00076 [Actinomyces johnsonii F0510]|uniref:Uncharacterized protein n=1 Tax=Actinomyces johnsonii F0510 TaxID=1227262 RepID=U1RVH9_9ACTO|nr:hypothetical protein HMPREF1549_00076 [Actinomyces johnsonii F0510]